MARRIAYLIENLHYGGTERHLIEVLTYLDRARYEPTVFCRSAGGPLVPVIEGLGVRVNTYDIGRWWAPRGLWRVKRLSDDLRDLAPEVVSVYMGNFFLPEVMACLAGGARRLLINHRGAMLNWKRRFYFAARQADRFATMHVACSHAVAEFLLEHELADPRKLAIFYNGVNLEPFHKPVDTAALRESLGIGPEAFVIGVVSRLIPSKRHVDLVDALALLRDEGREFRCVMVGDGGARADIERRIAERQLGDRIVLAGARPDGREIVRAFDVTALPTLVEGSPNSLIESMLSGVPVISTDAPGVREIMNHGVTSLVVPPEDPAALAAAVRQLMDHPDLRHRLAENAKAYAEETFDLKRMLEGFMEVYDRVATGSPSRGGLAPGIPG